MGLIIHETCGGTDDTNHMLCASIAQKSLRCLGGASPTPHCVDETLGLAALLLRFEALRAL